MLSFLSRCLLTVLSALLISFAFPSFLSIRGMFPLAFIALVPMFLVVRKSRWYDVAFQGFLYGFVYYLVYNYWLKTFHPLAILIAPILRGVEYALFFPFLKAASSLFGKRSYIAQSIIYTSFLYLLEQGFLGYPYGNVATALYPFTLFIQSVDIFGIWGLCLLLSLMEGLVAEMLYHRSTRGYGKDMLVISILMLSNLIYGGISYTYYSLLEPERTLRIASVQHSADSWEGGYETYKRNFETMRDLSLEALEENEGIDLVAWSETAFVPSVAWHTQYPSNWLTSALVEDFVNFGENLEVPLLTGNPDGEIADESLPAILENGEWNIKYYNSTIFFNEGRIEEEYRKQRLVPFTEHFPYQEQMPRFTALLLANDYNWWEKGEEKTVFEYDGIRFSTPICFEDTFGYLSAGFVAEGADLLINLTNDSWSGSVPAEVQHMTLALFRAIENRRPLLRSTNSGITCLINERGEVINPLEPFTRTYGIYDIEIGKTDSLSFYTRHPDLLAKLLTALLPLLYASGSYCWIRRRRKKKEEELYLYYRELLESLDEDVMLF